MPIHRSADTSCNFGSRFGGRWIRSPAITRSHVCFDTDGESASRSNSIPNPSFRMHFGEHLEKNSWVNAKDFRPESFHEMVNTDSTTLVKDFRKTKSKAQLTANYLGCTTSG